MFILGQLSAKVWFVLLLALGFLVSSVLIIVATAQENRANSARASSTRPPSQATAMITGSNQVDTTEDYKALGYTDNRKVVRDDEGNLYVAYRKKWQGQYRIFIAKSTDEGNRWQVLNDNQPVETVGDYTQRVPSLAIGRNTNDNANFLHLVWYGNDQDHGGNERQIKYLRLNTVGKRSSDDCCATAVNIAGYSGQNLWQEHPAIYVNGSNVYIVWEGRDATSANAKIKFIRSTNFGRTWSAPADIVPATRINFSRPTLAVAYHNKVRQLYVVAYGESNKLSQIYWSRSLDNGDRWAAWQPVAPSATDQRHVSMVRDAADNLHIVWREVENAQATVLRYRVFNPALAKGAGQWTAAAETIAANPGHCLFFPSIAIDEQKQVWVVWTESSDCRTVPSDDPTTGQIAYRVKRATGQWNPITPLISNGAHLYASLRSGHSPSGKQMDLVWLDVTQCSKSQEQGQQTPTVEQDSTATVACVIRYTRLP